MRNDINSNCLQPAETMNTNSTDKTHPIAAVSSETLYSTLYSTSKLFGRMLEELEDFWDAAMTRNQWKLMYIVPSDLHSPLFIINGTYYMAVCPCNFNEKRQNLLQYARLRNELYCVEWDVKPYYTILYNTCYKCINISLCKFEQHLTLIKWGPLTN